MKRMYIPVPAPGTIQVFDLLGRLRLRGQAGAPSTQSLNLQSLPDGAYFLRFEGEGSGGSRPAVFGWR
ncbi:MAG: T9SS type A sorting domain-containing protein [Haliscomenobacter sp.]|nr:T9SS type A sorting domain-containing protein [Haliscomenobacter sp.]